MKIGDLVRYKEDIAARMHWPEDIAVVLWVSESGEWCDILWSQGNAGVMTTTIKDLEAANEGG